MKVERFFLILQEKMKIQFIIFFLLSVISISYSQKKDCREDFLAFECNEEEISWKQIEYKNQKINYFLVYKTPIVSESTNGKCKFYGRIVLSIDKSNFKKKEINSILTSINEELNLEEFYAYSTCEAVKISMAAFDSPLKRKERQNE